jgi:ABC transporter substrate binding protein
MRRGGCGSPRPTGATRARLERGRQHLARHSLVCRRRAARPSLRSRSCRPNSGCNLRCWQRPTASSIAENPHHSHRVHRRVRSGRGRVRRNPKTGTLGGKFYLAEFQRAATALAVKPDTAVVYDARDIEAAIATLGSRRDSGLVVAPDGFAQAHDVLIVGLAARHRVPAVFGVGNFARSGGLMSYGPDFVEVFRRAGSYIDRIVRGERPADLPVQAPTKFELVINLKTAKALGMTVPPMLLVRADEVIE